MFCHKYKHQGERQRCRYSWTFQVFVILVARSAVTKPTEVVRRYWVQVYSTRVEVVSAIPARQTFDKTPRIFLQFSCLLKLIYAHIWPAKSQFLFTSYYYRHCIFLVHNSNFCLNTHDYNLHNCNIYTEIFCTQFARGIICKITNLIAPMKLKINFHENIWSRL